MRPEYSWVLDISACTYYSYWEWQAGTLTQSNPSSPHIDALTRSGATQVFYQHYHWWGGLGVPIDTTSGQGWPGPVQTHGVRIEDVVMVGMGPVIKDEV